MAKYTEQNIIGYNTSPPADDGSETDANRINWSKIKEKLTDPHNTAIEAVDDAVAAMAATTFFNNTQAKTANFTVAATDQGDLFITTNAITATLTAAATLGKGFACAFYNNDASNNLTIDPNASETINGSATLTVGPEEGVIIVNDGSNWFAPGRFFTETTVPNATETTAGIVEKATVAEMEAGTADKYPDAALIRRSPGVAKCWLAANISGGINASYNITSITDAGVGRVSVTIATNFSSASWVTLGSIGSTNGLDRHFAFSTSTARTAGTVEIQSRSGGALADPTEYCFAGFGDQ